MFMVFKYWQIWVVTIIYKNADTFRKEFNYTCDRTLELHGHRVCLGYWMKYMRSWRNSKVVKFVRKSYLFFFEMWGCGMCLDDSLLINPTGYENKILTVPVDIPLLPATGSWLWTCRFFHVSHLGHDGYCPSIIESVSGFQARIYRIIFRYLPCIISK